MNDIEQTKIATGTIDRLVYPHFTGRTVNAQPSDAAMINIMCESSYGIADEFIIAVIRRDESHAFYKYLLEVVTPLNPGRTKDAICVNLYNDIRTYIYERLNDRLKLQLDTHDAIVVGEYDPKSECDRYPIMMAELYHDTAPYTDVIGPIPQYKQRKPMRVPNSVPDITARICCAAYCDGSRHHALDLIVRRLSGTIIKHNELYLDQILKKYESTGCIIKAIIHGIKIMLPKPVSLHELDKQLWDDMILATIVDIRNHYIDKLPESDYILDEVTKQFKGTSSFSNRDLISAVLGYTNLETVDLVLESIEIMREETPNWS